MLTYDVANRGGMPLYEYLYTSIKNDVLSGKIRAGEKLPSKREFAKHLGISTITVVNAYEQLSAEGYVISKEKKGYFVADIGTTVTAQTKKNTLIASETAAGEKALDHPGNGFPFSLWAKVMRRVLTDKYDSLLLPAPYNGVPELRRAIAFYLYRTRGLEVSPENIVVGAGTEYLYNLIIQLFDRNFTVATEDPGHAKISKIYTANGIGVEYIRVDGDGLSVQQLKKSRADILHFSPSHHYPTGQTTLAGKRRNILAWAEKENKHIIEDDYDSEFRLSGKPVETLMSMDRAERVIYINTFSKSISPSVRISYMVLPPLLAEAFRKKLGFYSCTVPVFEQYTLAEFISEGYFERHVNRMKTYCRRQRDTLPSLLEECGLSSKCKIIGKDSGLHFILKINTTVSDKTIKEEAKKQGLNLFFVSDYLHIPNPAFDHMMIADYFLINRDNLALFSSVLTALSKNDL